MGQRRNTTESNLLYFASEVERMGEELSLSEPVLKTAVQLYIQALKNEYRTKTIDRATATCLYLATHVQNATTTMDEIASVSRRERKNIYQESKTISDLLGLPIQPKDPTAFVEKFAGKLGWDDEAVERAMNLCEAAKSEGLQSGKKPTAVAASVLYARSKLEGFDHTQKEISDICDVTQVTIRNSYPDVMEIDPESTARDLASRDFEKAFQVIETAIDLSDDLCGEARQRAKMAAENEVSEGASKGGLAAAAYIVTARENGHDVGIARMADVVAVGTDTVRSYLEVV